MKPKEVQRNKNYYLLLPSDKDIWKHTKKGKTGLYFRKISPKYGGGWTVRTTFILNKDVPKMVQEIPGTKY